MNAEGFGALYQDLLTTPGATLNWSFSHAARHGADKNQMYIVMGATQKAQEIISLDNITDLVRVAENQDTLNQISSSGSGFEFTYDGCTYRIWYNDANSGVGVWESVSGYYIVPGGQYLTRLFFVSNPLNLNQDKTMGNLIDGVSAGESMSCIIQYYVNNQAHGPAQDGTLLRPNTTLELERLDYYLNLYRYPVKILANGRNYPGTLEDLKKGLYITDYGEKTEAVQGYRQDIVLQIYFQEPNIIATKTVEVVGMTASQINEILNNGGFNANIKLEKQGDATDTFEAKFNITQYSSSNKLTMESSFEDSTGAYVTVYDYGKTFTVSETDATPLDNYKLVTTIKTGNDKDNLSEGNTVKITTDNTIGFVDVTNTYYPMGNLQVSKFVDTGINGIAITETQRNHSFLFTVTLEGDIPNELYGPYHYTIKTFADSAVPSEGDSKVGEGTISLNESKTLTFNLKHNQYIVIEDLPAVNYTISETQMSGYQTPSFILEHPYVTDDGSFKGYITVGDTEEVQCSNAPVVAMGDLQITKNVVDSSQKKDAPKQGFVFTVTLNNVSNPIITSTEEDGAQLALFPIRYSSTKGIVTDNQSYTVNYENDEVHSYDLTQYVEIRLIGDNSYQFTITLYDGLTATIPNLPYCTYNVVEDDYSAQKFEAVFKGETGTLGGEKVDGNNPVSTVTFTNNYPMHAGDLEITKTVLKAYKPDPMGADTFSFTIRPKTEDVVFEGSYVVEVNGEQSTVQVANGVLTVQIPFAEDEMNQVTKEQPLVKSLTVYDLPMGVYIVEEEADDAYIQTVAGTNQSGLSVETTVGATTAEVGFQNEFKRITGTLTITKNVVGTVDGAFLFHLTGTDSGGKPIDMDVIIDEFSDGTGSVTIHDLPIGNYTVKEDTNWNWRYTTTDSEKTAKITDTVRQGNVEFTNTYDNSKWLNFFANMLNKFELS